MNKYLILEVNISKFKYVYLKKQNKENNGYEKIISLGRSDELAKKNKNYLEIFRQTLNSINHSLTPEEIKVILLSKLGPKERVVGYNTGSELLAGIIKSFNIFELLPKTKHEKLEAAFEYYVISRIFARNWSLKYIDRRRQIAYKTIEETNAFYELINLLYENRAAIFKRINEKISEKTNRNIELMLYNCSDIIFEYDIKDEISLYEDEDEWLRALYNYDKVTMGIATDENGIPIFMKMYSSDTTKSNTIVEFIKEMKEALNISKTTIIANKGILTNKNAKFLAENNIDFIFGHQLKTAPKDLYSFAINKSGYKKLNNELKYKEFESKLQSNDKNSRKIIITKNISKDEKEDQIEQYHVYQTSRTDLNAVNIIKINNLQNEIQDKFKTFRDYLKIDALHFLNSEQVIGQFVLYFISLVVLKYTIYLVNKYYKDNKQNKIITIAQLIDSLDSHITTEFYEGDKLIKVCDGRMGTYEPEINFREIENTLKVRSNSKNSSIS